MKTPGDTGQQDIAIDQLDTRPYIGLVTAVETAADLGATPAHYESETETTEIDADFVINAIDFRTHDLFLWEGHGRFEVLATNQYSPGLSLIHPESPRTEAKNTKAFDLAKVYSYSRLWRDWLRGAVIPLTRETAYVRRDTEDCVLVRDEYQSRIDPQEGDIAFVGPQRGLVTEVRTDGETDEVVLETEIDLHGEPCAEREWTVPIPDLDRLERSTDA